MLTRVRIADDQYLLVLPVFILVSNLALLDQFEFLHERLTTLTFASIIVEISYCRLRLGLTFALFFDDKLTNWILILPLCRYLTCKIAMAVCCSLQRLYWFYP